MQSQLDDDIPLFSKNEIREIRLAMAAIMDENEELRSKIIVMDQMVKAREATIKKAKMFIEALEQKIRILENINLN